MTVTTKSPGEKITKLSFLRAPLKRNINLRNQRLLLIFRYQLICGSYLMSLSSEITNIHYNKWDFCAPSTLSLRRRVLRLRSSLVGVVVFFLVGPSSILGLFLRKISCDQNAQPPFSAHLTAVLNMCNRPVASTPGMGLPSFGLIWNSVGLASKLSHLVQTLCL
ncbi:hypothetical protein T03_1296 [Trichinella britovi]|uniref:Uncharacterized protein n=1 Tax=Trichinella britovi TaxID=45882 RepID=A0A0V1CCN8_TRIBR|nr:hypothetical protein T03_1296 [Trichinella britovi]